MGLLTENNAHYYSGQQMYVQTTGTGTNVNIPWEGDATLIATTSVSNTNYRVTKNNIAITQNVDYSLVGTSVVIVSTAVGDVIIIELFTPVVQSNYGSYAYISVEDIVNNFQVAYVGEDKLIAKVKRTDIIFHAKRGLQEFSYDTLNSIKSQELTIPLNLSVPLPKTTLIL